MRINARRTHRAWWSLVLSSTLVVVATNRAQTQNLLDFVRDPGELELRANPITIDNPVPTLIVGRSPIYPGEAVGTGAAGTVIFRITVDDTGAVVEARYLGHDRWGLREVRGHLEAAPMLDATFLAASEHALRGWLYEPPVTAPVALDVEFEFTGEGRARTVWQQPAPPIQPTPPADVADSSLPSLKISHPDALIAGDQVGAPSRIKGGAPAYPPEALTQHLEGTVLMDILIGSNGRVTDTRVLRARPELAGAAVAAVERWEFAPTIVDGSPVAVITTVVVNFTLAR